ncbi:septum formation initiator [Micromonospora sp. WMMA2032]|uniref:septum formation initiator n=1 Tax=Micromonospora TaxID=1873 RepID=UPI000C05B5FC|nr:septum formation initiator [Micromonospora sp. WMMA2032]ATO14764.1 septum formation initiator [Micromonospora sp. WMMA2032]
MDRRSWLAVAGWLATTAAATLVGLAAVDLVGAGITGTAGGVRTEQDVARALAEPGAAPTRSEGATPVPTTGGPSTPGGSRRGFVTAGGSVEAECGPAGVRVVTWSPAPGYRTKDDDRGPDDHVEIRFVGASDEYELRLRCRDGVPVRDLDD